MIDFFIQPVWAEGAAQPQGSPWASLIPLIILFVLFYFLLIRPQTKRMKEHKQMVEALATGDEVVTNGGLLGKITKLGEDFIVIELAPNLEVKVQRHAVSNVLPKGTMNNV